LLTGTLPAAAAWTIYDTANVVIPANCVSVRVDFIAPAGMINVLQVDAVYLQQVQDITVGGSFMPACKGAVIAGYTAPSSWTHIFLDAAGTFGANLVNATPPFNLFRAQANYITYFGASTLFTAIRNAPANIAMYLTGADGQGIIGAWEYWSGAAWTAAVFVNQYWKTYNPAYTFGRDGFGLTALPFVANMTAVAVNGITAYWWRFVPSSWAVAGSFIQAANFAPFASRRPYAIVPAASVKSELAAWARHFIFTYNPLNGTIYRQLLATRSISRGAAFDPIINFTEYQENTDISIVFSPGPVWTANRLAAAGRTLNIAGSLGMMITIIGPTSNSYVGRFRAILRMKQSGGTAGDISATLRSSYGPILRSGVTTSLLDMNALDFGIIQIPAASYTVGKTVGDIQLFLNMVNAGAGTAILYDLILLPVDEFAMELQVNSQAGSGFYMPGQVAYADGTINKLLIDTPRMAIDDNLSLRINDLYAGITTTRPFLQPNEDQLLIVIPLYLQDSSAQLELDIVDTYLNMKGSV